MASKSLLAIGVVGPLLLTGIACSSSQGQGKRRSEVDSCIELVAGYVTKTRGWARDSYTIRAESADDGGRGFAVLHESDNVRSRPPGGGGKSFHVDVDAACRRVTLELAYQ
jgi:hypothetical protein